MEISQLYTLINHFSDTGRCEDLQRMFAATLSEWEVAKADATLSSGTTLPNEPGIYMFVWRPAFYFPQSNGSREHFPVVLYIGKTGDRDSEGTIRSRFASEYAPILRNADTHNDEDVHEGQMTRTDKLKIGLSLQPLEFWFSVVKNSKNVGKLEDQILRMIRPPLNTVLPRIEPLTPRSIWQKEPK